MVRIIIRVDGCTPDGGILAPTYRTVDIRDANLERALQTQGYTSAAVIGAERITESEGE
jgi:hypothetical protein